MFSIGGKKQLHKTFFNVHEYGKSIGTPMDKQNVKNKKISFCHTKENKFKPHFNY